MTGILLNASEMTLCSGAAFAVWYYGIKEAITQSLWSLCNGILLILALMTLTLAAPALHACTADISSVSHSVARRRSPGNSPRDFHRPSPRASRHDMGGVVGPAGVGEE